MAEKESIPFKSEQGLKNEVLSKLLILSDVLPDLEKDGYVLSSENKGVYLKKVGSNNGAILLCRKNENSSLQNDG